MPGVLMCVLHGDRVWLVFRISSVLDFDRFEFGCHDTSWWLVWLVWCALV